MYRALVVDDETAVCQGLRVIIPWRQLGFLEPDCAGSADEALSALASADYHLLITDIEMPGMSGLDLLKSVRTAAPRVRCIVISGYSQFEYARAAIERGVLGYILKPISREELGEKVAGVRAELDAEATARLITTGSLEIAGEKLLLGLALGTLSEAEQHALGEEFSFLSEHDAMCSVLFELVGPSSAAGPSAPRGEVQALKQYLRSETILGVRGHLYEDADGRIGCFLRLGEPHAHRRALRRLLEDVQRKALTLHAFRVRVACGRPVGRIGDVSLSRRQALRAIADDIITGDPSIIFASSAGVSSAPVSADRGNLKRILQAVETLDISAIDREAAALINEVVDATRSVSAAQALLNRLLLALHGHLLRYGLDRKQVMEKHLFALEHSEGAMDSERLRRLVVEMSLSAVRCIRGASEGTGPNLIDRVIGLVGEDIAGDLRLKSVARRLGVNAAYLGQAFRKSTGVYYSEFVNRRRLEEARRLVTQGLPVDVIVERVGLSDASYFYKLHRRLEGRGLADYRRSLQDIDRPSAPDQDEQ